MYLNDINPPSSDLLQYASEMEIKIKRGTGKKEAYDIVFASLNEIDRIAFFTFCMYRYLSEDRRGNLNTHPYKHRFYEFANSICTDERFIKSLNRYSGSEIRYFAKYGGGSTNTIAYKITSEYLNQSFGLVKVKNFIVNKNTPVREREYNKNKEEESKVGCLYLIISLVPIIGIIYSFILWFDHGFVFFLLGLVLSIAVYVGLAGLLSKYI